MHPPLVARCVRGLESVLAAEILDRGLGTVTALRHRAVHFAIPFAPTARAPRPRTADDVFLLAAQAGDPGRTKPDLTALTGLADRTDPGRLLSRRRALLPAADRPTGIDVSASFLGRRTFSRYDAEDAVGTVLARRLGLPYHSRRTGEAPPPGTWGWRLTLDGGQATLMARIDDRPAHRRPYKHRTVPGTLHPPVAAALAALADLRPGHTVLDPCCGAGTLLIEAALTCPGVHCHGFDLSPDAVAAARANARSLPVTVRRSDAGRLPVPAGFADRVLCNPPWGAQVRPGGVLAVDPSRWWAEVRRVLAPDGTAVLLLPDPAALTDAVRHRLTPVHVQRVRLAGAQPFVVRLRPDEGRLA
ncbi:methyltransferase domain-containing protein [Streptomyces sp. NPDC052012]|uniref:methyltransferase domain-containing protein n=1 Tax=Streptomyces sp. NPDC052012 TaxID=3155051 RepID=UPI00344D5E52